MTLLKQRIERQRSRVSARLLAEGRKGIIPRDTSTLMSPRAAGSTC